MPYNFWRKLSKLQFHLYHYETNHGISGVVQRSLRLNYNVLIFTLYFVSEIYILNGTLKHHYLWYLGKITAFSCDEAPQIWIKHEFSCRTTVCPFISFAVNFVMLLDFIKAFYIHIGLKRNISKIWQARCCQNLLYN